MTVPKIIIDYKLNYVFVQITTRDTILYDKNASKNR